MSFWDSMRISASALTAQRLRLIASCTVLMISKRPCLRAADKPVHSLTARYLTP